MKLFLVVLILLAAVVIVGLQSVFIVDQTQYAVVTRFGEIQRAVSQPGLQFKQPFTEEAAFFDNRLLRIDMLSEPMQDKEKQILDIDAYVRYRITDPKKFLVRLRDEITAESRLSNIVTSELRRVVADSDRTDIIGGSTTTLPDGTIRVDPKRADDGLDTREAITRQVIKGVNAAVQSAENDYGVVIMDVRVKAADFPTTVEESVFIRMRTEREVQAKRLRAEGEQEYLTITADVDRQVTIIRSEAEKTANQLRGEGEGQAIGIYASALQRDPEFYAFQRNLEMLKKALAENTTLVLSSKDTAFKYLDSPNAPKP